MRAGISPASRGGNRPKLVEKMASPVLGPAIMDRVSGARMQSSMVKDYFVDSEVAPMNIDIQATGKRQITVDPTPQRFEDDVLWNSKI